MLNRVIVDVAVAIEFLWIGCRALLPPQPLRYRIIRRDRQCRGAWNDGVG